MHMGVCITTYPMGGGELLGRMVSMEVGMRCTWVTFRDLCLCRYTGGYFSPDGSHPAVIPSKVRNRSLGRYRAIPKHLLESHGTGNGHDTRKRTRYRKRIHGILAPQRLG